MRAGIFRIWFSARMWRNQEMHLDNPVSNSLNPRNKAVTTIASSMIGEFELRVKETSFRETFCFALKKRRQTRSRSPAIDKNKRLSSRSSLD